MPHVDDMEYYVSGAGYHGLRAPKASDGPWPPRAKYEG